MRYVSFLFLVCFFASCVSFQKVDMIVLNAKVYTVDSAFSVAQAFAVSDGKIVAVGKNNYDITNKYVSENVVDAKGNAVFPGFIDAHAHFVGYGRGLFEVDLFDCKDWAEAVERVKVFAKEYPEEP